MNVVERGTCLRVCVSVITKMSKRTSTERVARSYWDWLPPELQQWILRLVRLDAANLLQQLVAKPGTFKRLKERFDLQREKFRPSWWDIPFIQRRFSQGPLLWYFSEDLHATPYARKHRPVINHFFAVDGFQHGPHGPFRQDSDDIDNGFRNVDALVCSSIIRIYCAYGAWQDVNDEIDDEYYQAGDDNYYCDTFQKLRLLVQRAFQSPPRNRRKLRRVESDPKWLP